LDSNHMTRRKLPSLAGLRAFEVAGRHSSFSKAADELGVTQGAVSKLIRQLESEVGVALFKRLARTVELTEEGKTYFQAIRVSFESMESATRTLRDEGHADVLQVSCLPTLATTWFMPRLASFTQKHRNVEVRLSTSIAPADFQRGELDVAIRVGRKEPGSSNDRVSHIDLEMAQAWAGLKAELLFPDRVIPVCSDRLPGPPLRHPRDLAHHTLLHNSTRSRAWPDWLRIVGIPDLRPKHEEYFGHFFMCLQAAAQGRGVAIVPSVLILDQTPFPGLRIPFRLSAESDGAYYAIYRQSQADEPKIRSFCAWLREEARLASAAIEAYAEAPDAEQSIAATAAHGSKFSPLGRAS
jgi:LysR family glycine cleavage system transcriptional activator